jgi:crotonobetainyl-CoA:carnitine CoA-transferase CaiB-like acyl-CoA transferase
VKPLTGVTVLDFSRVLAGPMATQILAELGAEVIKIERPRVGDESRHYEPILAGGESAYFFAFNRGKRSVTINLKSEAGQDLARRLCAHADVVVENFLPDVMAGLGLGYQRLAADNPGLVYVSNTGFGQFGPYRDRNGYDTVFQALSGIMSLTGYPDAPPAKAGVPVADMTSALWTAIAVLTGLVGRGVRGRGAHIDVAMMDVQVSLLALAAARVFALGEQPSRVGTEHAGRVPSAAFECADGRWLQISGSDQHWDALCAVLGLDELAADASLARNAGRVAERARVMAALRAAIAGRPRDLLADALRAAGVPVGEVNSVAEVLADPHVAARQLVSEFDHPTEGVFPALRTPLRLDGFDDPAPLSPPLLGSDTRRVLADKLGLSDAEVNRLHDEGTI